MNFLKNKSILITGGTGSFGQKFVEKVLNSAKVKRLVIFSRDEFKQDLMKKKFFNNYKVLRFFLGDVRDLERLNKAMYGIDFVVHAAALKQVVAAEYNPTEFLKTNVIGAQNVIDSAINNKIKKVIALSTDKAVNPINFYGATKLASDKLFIAANNIVGKNKTRFSIVRYGNVIGSRGSVLEYFKQIKTSGSNIYPITDTRMTRFWISLEEGVIFSLKCLNVMIGGEILIKKSPSIKIIDLVKAFNESAKIKIIGIRPGEKVNEVLISKDDSNNVLEFKNHYLIKPSINLSFLNDYTKNSLNEKGKKISTDFEYNSELNIQKLNIKEIKKKILY